MTAESTDEHADESVTVTEDSVTPADTSDSASGAEVNDGGEARASEALEDSTNDTVADNQAGVQDVINTETSYEVAPNGEAIIKENKETTKEEKTELSEKGKTQSVTTETSTTTTTSRGILSDSIEEEEKDQEKLKEAFKNASTDQENSITVTEVRTEITKGFIDGEEANLEDAEKLPEDYVKESSSVTITRTTEVLDPDGNAKQGWKADGTEVGVNAKDSKDIHTYAAYMEDGSYKTLTPSYLKPVLGYINGNGAIISLYGSGVWAVAVGEQEGYNENYKVYISAEKQGGINAVIDKDNPEYMPHPEVKYAYLSQMPEKIAKEVAEEDIIPAVAYREMNLYGDYNRYVKADESVKLPGSRSNGYFIKNVQYYFVMDTIDPETGTKDKVYFKDYNVKFDTQIKIEHEKTIEKHHTAQDKYKDLGTEVIKYTDPETEEEKEKKLSIKFWENDYVKQSGEVKIEKKGDDLKITVPYQGKDESGEEYSNEYEKTVKLSDFNGQKEGVLNVHIVPTFCREEEAQEKNGIEYFSEIYAPAPTDPVEIRRSNGEFVASVDEFEYFDYRNMDSHNGEELKGLIRLDIKELQNLDQYQYQDLKGISVEIKMIDSRWNNIDYWSSWGNRSKTTFVNDDIIQKYTNNGQSEITQDFTSNGDMVKSIEIIVDLKIGEKIITKAIGYTDFGKIREVNGERMRVFDLNEEILKLVKNQPGRYPVYTKYFEKVSNAETSWDIKDPFIPIPDPKPTPTTTPDPRPTVRESRDRDYDDFTPVAVAMPMVLGAEREEPEQQPVVVAPTPAVLGAGRAVATGDSSLASVFGASALASLLGLFGYGLGSRKKRK